MLMMTVSERGINLKPKKWQHSSRYVFTRGISTVNLGEPYLQDDTYAFFGSYPLNLFINLIPRARRSVRPSPHIHFFLFRGMGGVQLMDGYKYSGKKVQDRDIFESVRSCLEKLSRSAVCRPVEWRIVCV